MSLPQKPMANPRKRPRSHSLEHLADEAIGFEQDENLWFDDGSIVLVAESNHAYRVHSSVLALHSQVFRDMLTIGQSTEGQEMMDGRPIVQLSDKKEDIEELLRILYHPNTLRKDKGIGYNVVLPLLQLSRKYEIDFIREEVIQFLHLEFPSSLAKFERTYYEKPTDAPPWDSIDRELIALRAGLTFGIPEILPAAYYFCCQLPLASLFKLKIDVSDGTDQPIPADQSKTDTCSDKDGAIPEDEPKNDVPDDMDKFIPADHLKTILLGREKLLRLKRTFVDDFVAKYLDVEVCLHCPHLKDVCLRFLSEDAGEKYDNDLSFFFGGNEVADRFRVAASKWNVCSRCLNERRAAEVNGRKTAWEKLPSCFGLQEWSEVGKGNKNST